MQWSPLSLQPNMVALGTKDSAGGGFDDYGGELEIHMLDFSNSQSSSSVVLGKTKADAKFASLAWSKMSKSTANFPSGIIAGGMLDGNIHIWDPAKIAAGDPNSLLSTIHSSPQTHTGAVNGLHFSPIPSHSYMLASGGADSEVYVMSLERPDEPLLMHPGPPPNTVRHTTDVTKVAWNSQVEHIIASSSQNGSTIIWDLKQKKPWCELRDPTGGVVSDIAWNPTEAVQFATACGDDKNPVIKLWDLRASTTLPFATLQGHTEGILSISWCPNDPFFMLSCGKDNKTVMWDLMHLEAVYDLPTSSSAGPGGSGNMGGYEQNTFGGLASTAGQQRRFNVSWSPCLPAVVSACSFDRKVQFYSLSGARSRKGRAPAWLRRPVGASFGFGGKLVSFTNQAPVIDPSFAADPKKSAGVKFRMKITQVVEDEFLIRSCDEFHSAIAAGDFKTFCETKVASASTEHDRNVWQLMQVICFGDNARELLLAHLGFDSAAIAASVQTYIGSEFPSNVEVSGKESQGSDTTLVSSLANMSVVGTFGAPPPTSVFDVPAIVESNNTSSDQILPKVIPSLDSLPGPLRAISK